MTVNNYIYIALLILIPCLVRCVDLTLPDGVQVLGLASVGGAARHQISSIGVEVDVADRLGHPQTLWDGFTETCFFIDLIKI